MELLDSRRLPGANILWERPGAVIDVAADSTQLPVLISAWEIHVRERLDGVGWQAEATQVRLFPDGASLAISAPLDALYAATEVNESAWSAACAQHSGEPIPDLQNDLERLRREINGESNPALLALRAAAIARNLSFLSDDDDVSVGLGTGCQSWPVNDLPAPSAVSWTDVHDVPTTLITGTNGKTTTARLLASIVDAAGKTPGISSTDRVRVGSELLEEGDWSGPGGARLVMRHPRTQVGILETARGGMLRRGLALEHTNVAAVLNVGADHLGEWGVGTLDGLAEGKFTVTRVADVAVLNADDEVVAARGQQLNIPVIWFGLEPQNPRVLRHLEEGGDAYLLDGDELCHRKGSETLSILPVAKIPATLAGAARYNIANALAAAAIAGALGFGLDSIRKGLSRFQNSTETNPGRLNIFELGGVKAIVDFAHNPHGFDAICKMMATITAKRRLVLLGQAGDRDEPSIREMTRITWRARPDLIVIKELTGHLRGRELGEIPALIEGELRREGAPPDRFVHSPSEMDSVRLALEWSQPGDLLMLFVHDNREEVLRMLGQLAESEWTPGDPLPPA
ncbi:MAG: cyanophycin synthetase [Planctomycetota bacterium]|jgi:cyanophycin synthetase